MHPDDPIGTEQRPDKPVIVQLDFPYAFNALKRKRCYKQYCIRLAQMIEDDHRRSLFGEIFQPGNLGTHRDKSEEFCEPAQNGTKESPRERKTRQRNQLWPPNV